jgi:hypothetical protein
LILKFKEVGPCFDSSPYLSSAVNRAISGFLKLKNWVLRKQGSPSLRNETPMSNLHELMDFCPRSSAQRASGVEPRRTWAKRMTRCLLSFLILWFTAVLAGCGATPEQVKEEQKGKQQVVQEKMKEYMQQKAKAKGLRR